jgi:prepilin-type processing-associated H-X9-DG protein
VQKVREAAARSKCTNNLKQMGIATHMYQDTNGKLPAGWVTNPSGTPAPSPGWSWSLLILPYMEQAPLYNLISPDIVTPTGPPATPVAGAAYLSVVPSYLCPSDGSPTQNGNFNNYTRINYVVNRFVFGPDGSNRPYNYTVQTISDGSSNTVLIGERDMVTNVAGSAYIRHSNTSASFEGRFGQMLNPQPTAGTKYTNSSDQRLAFTSKHTGGCNFVFGDGSVRFLNNSLPCDPSDSWLNFPTVHTPLSTNYVGQLLELPTDGLPVNIP